MGMERESAVAKSTSSFRWFVLAAFVLGSMSNAMAWLTFAPVPLDTAAYYGISVNQVDIFSVIFMLVSIPVGILCIYLVDRIGLRYSLYCAMVFNTLGRRCDGLHFSTMELIRSIVKIRPIVM